MTPEDIQLGPLLIRFLVESEDSHGSSSVFEVHVPPAARVPAPHSHDAFEETIYGLDGTMRWTVEGIDHDLGHGDVVCIRRGEVHGFVNATDEPARALCVVTPAVLGPQYFRDLREVVAAGGPPDPEQIGAVMRRHGLTPAS